MFPAFRSRVAGLSLLWLDLARQRRDITQRHPWLPQAMHSPRALGPNTLRYINYFLGLLRRTGLDTAAKMELLGLVNGFALSYGGVQAPLAEERARTGVTAEQQAAALVHAPVAAAATGRYPELAAALAGPAAPPREADEVLCSALRRSIRTAGPLLTVIEPAAQGE